MRSENHVPQDHLLQSKGWEWSARELPGHFYYKEFNQKLGTTPGESLQSCLLSQDDMLRILEAERGRPLESQEQNPERSWVLASGLHQVMELDQLGDILGPYSH